MKKAVADFLASDEDVIQYLHNEMKAHEEFCVTHTMSGDSPKAIGSAAVSMYLRELLEQLSSKSTT